MVWRTIINKHLKNQLKSPHFSIFNDAAYIVRFNYYYYYDCYYHLCEHGEQRVCARDLTHFTLDCRCASILFFFVFILFRWNKQIVKLQRRYIYILYMNRMTDGLIWKFAHNSSSNIVFPIERNFYFIISFKNNVIS